MVYQMSVNDESTASRQFMVSYSVYSLIWEKITGRRASIYIQAGFWAIVVLVVLHMVGPMFGLHLGAPIPGKVTATPAMQLSAGHMFPRPKTSDPMPWPTTARPETRPDFGSGKARRRSAGQRLR